MTVALSGSIKIEAAIRNGLPLIDLCGGELNIDKLPPLPHDFAIRGDISVEDSRKLFTWVGTNKIFVTGYVRIRREKLGGVLDIYLGPAAPVYFGGIFMINPFPLLGEWLDDC